MPDPHDTLSIFAEVSVALAGFSGIVIAFGRRSVGELTQLESRRLFNLFAFSGLVMILSLIGMSLLHLEIFDAGVLWRCGSGILIVISVPWLVFDWRKVGRLNVEERNKVPNQIIYPFTVLSILALLLQLANLVSWGAASPFFLGLVLAVAFAFQQFILLIRSGRHDV